MAAPKMTPHTHATSDEHPKRFVTHQEFVDEHRALDLRVRTYLERTGRNHQTLTLAQREELRVEKAKFWLANNADARIALAQLASRHFSVLEASLAGDACVNMVTLIPGRYAMERDCACEFHPRSLMAWARQELIGFDFIAMVEPAFYGNVGRYMKGSPSKMVSWHVHGLVWGADQSSLQERMDYINRRHTALLPGVDVALALPDQREDWAARLRYLLKGVLWEYRIWPDKRPQVDASGRSVKVPTGRFWQRSQSIRPGDAVRMMRVMYERTLDGLLLAGGSSGKVLLEGIRREMFAKIPEQYRSASEQALVSRGARTLLGPRKCQGPRVTREERRHPHQ